MTARAAVDASVVVKWLLASSPREQDGAHATALVTAIASGSLEPLQPPHWLAEVMAAMARLEPETATETASFLHAMEWPVLDDPDVYVEACRLATALGQHVFDTLYHAVALCEAGTICVTADERYYRAARAVGSIVLLREFALPTDLAP